MNQIKSIVKQKIFYLLIIVLLSAGCSKREGDEQAEEKRNGGTSVKSSIVVCSYGGSYQEAQRKAVFEPFANKYGVEVKEDSYAGEFAKLKVMVDSERVIWDVVDAESFMVLRGAKEKLLVPIDYNIVDKTQLLLEATHKYGVAWCFWSTVIGYNTKAFPSSKAHPKNWAEFWDVNKFPGPRSLRRNPKGTLEFALLADGVSPKELYPLDLDRAFRSLDRIRPHVRVWWEAGEQPAQLLASGEVVLTSAWNGRIQNAADEGEPIAVEWGQGMLDADWWIIPRGCRNTDLAMKFIAFASKVAPQVENTKWIPYGPINRDAMSLVDPAIAPRLPTAPANLAEQFMINTEWWAENEAQVLERWNSWLIE